VHRQLYQNYVENNPNIDLSSFNDDDVIQPYSISDATSKSIVDGEIYKQFDSNQKNKRHSELQ